MSKFDGRNKPLRKARILSTVGKLTAGVETLL